MNKEKRYSKPYMFSDFHASVILPEWNLTSGTSDGETYRPSPSSDTHFELSNIGRCIKFEEMSKYDDDWLAVVRPKTEFCVLYVWNDYHKKNVAHFIDGTVDEVEEVLEKAFEQYHKDKELWEEIFEKAKEKFYERRKQ